MEEHTLHGIEEKLQLGRKDLVVMALLSGCDYGDGVKSIGLKKVLDLIHSIKKYSDDVLTRYHETICKTFRVELQLCMGCGIYTQSRAWGVGQLVFLSVLLGCP